MEKKIKSNPIIVNKITGIVFWDFDGVIKESLEAKAIAYCNIFDTKNDKLTNRIRDHHLKNGGVSRYIKIPIYISWAGLNPDKSTIDKYTDKFSRLVFQYTLESPWVSGVREFLLNKKNHQKFSLISAIPQDELDLLVKRLSLTHTFEYIIGSPTCKADAISSILKKSNIEPQHCLFIGDSEEDIESAQKNDVPFLLRMHTHNQNLPIKYSVPYICNFNS